MKVIAISGSLRARSSNAALLRAAAKLAPAGMKIVFYDGLAELPHFNPDLDLDLAGPPAAVGTLRRILEEADAIIISSPEYAHGVPGSLKNLLDWLVSDGELVGKPVVLFNASPGGGERAQASLVETLTVMNWSVLAGASLLAPFIRQKLGPDGDIDDPETVRALRSSLDALATAIRSR